MLSFRKGHQKHYPLQIQGEIPPALSNGSTLVFMATAVSRRDQVCKISCWGTEENPRSSPTAVFVPARPKQPVSHLPTASPHSAEGRRNRGHQRWNIPSPISIMPLCVGCTQFSFEVHLSVVFSFLGSLSGHQPDFIPLTPWPSESPALEMWNKLNREFTQNFP